MIHKNDEFRDLLISNYGLIETLKDLRSDKLKSIQDTRNSSESLEELKTIIKIIDLTLISLTNNYDITDIQLDGIKDILLSNRSRLKIEQSYLNKKVDRLDKILTCLKNR